MAKKQFLRNALRIVFFALFLILNPASFAQFNVFSWNNFETGTFPENLERLQDAGDHNAAIYDFTSPDAPAGILDGIARTECGRYGIKFNISKLKEYIKVVSKTTLDRRNMGERGKALYQADIFIPQDLSELPYSVAILAVLQEGEGLGGNYTFYRFGITGDSVFFSYTHNEPQPRLYRHTKIGAMNLKRPGWHRFQIIFDGQEDIICAVDGQPTSFSPIKEPTLDKLRAGIMVSSSLTDVGTVYFDNLSIQWTTEDVPLPDSPWTSAPKGSAAPVLGASTTQPDMKSSIRWIESPEEAWQMCLTQNRPLLILFYAPRAMGWKNLEQLIESNETVAKTINQFIPLRIDANQLRGGTLAYQFGAFKVPCFIVMGPDQQIRLKEFYSRESDWNPLSQKLQESLSR